MSSLVFVLAVAAYVAVVLWTRDNDRAGAQGGRKGLLRMRGAGADPASTAAGPAAPRWRQVRAASPPDTSPPPAPPRARTPSETKGPTPRWRRTF